MRNPCRPISPWQIAMTALLFLGLSQVGMLEGQAQTPQKEAEPKTLAVKAVAKPIKPLDTSIERIRVIRKNEQTEVRVEGSGPLYCVPFLLSRPDRLVLDFPGTAMRVQRPMIQGDVRPVRSVRFSQFKPVMARLVIDLDGQAPYLFAAKENFVTVVFNSRAVAMPAAAAKSEKKSYVVGTYVPATATPPPSPNQGQSKTEAKPSPGFSTKPAAVPVSPTAKDEKKPVVVTAFASATPAPSSVQTQTKISTPSPAGPPSTPEQSRSFAAPSSSLLQSNESSSAKQISLPQHATGRPATSDEKKSSPAGVSGPPTPASTPSLDPAPSKIEGRSSLGLPAPPATVPHSSPAASAALSSTSSPVEPSPTRAGSLSSAGPSSMLPQPSEHSTNSASWPQNDSYVLGPLDVVAINVWRDPELSRVEPVRPDGKISLPLIGDMQASGLTPKMLQMQIIKALEEYVRKPEVTVILQEANSHRFNLIGEVARPGSYLLASNMTVLDALAAGGGFRDFAKVTRIYVLRKMPNGSSERIPFNYKKAIKGSPDMNLQLLPGDTIVVP